MKQLKPKLIAILVAGVATGALSGTALAAEDKRAPERAGEIQAKGDQQIRDWKAIDKNNDNLISPEEMEAWLKANPGPQAKKPGG